MLPLLAAAAAPAIMKMGGSLLGGMLGGGDEAAAAAAEARRRALETLRGTNEEVGRSAYENEDPTARNAQLAALSKMSEVYNAGGMDPQSQAALQAAQQSNAAAERGARGAIVQNAAARGMGSGGAAIAAQLANQQGSAQRNAIAGTQAAGDARTRALQAMSQAGQQAGSIRGQDYQKAGALDSIKTFNANNRLKKSGMESDLYTGNAGTYDNQGIRKDEEGRAQGAGVGTAVSGIGSKMGWW